MIFIIIEKLKCRGFSSREHLLNLHFSFNEIHKRLKVLFLPCWRNWHSSYYRKKLDNLSQYILYPKNDNHLLRRKISFPRALSFLDRGIGVSSFLALRRGSQYFFLWLLDNLWNFFHGQISTDFSNFQVVMLSGVTLDNPSTICPLFESLHNAYWEISENSLGEVCISP